MGVRSTKVFGNPAQMDARKNDLGSRRAHINTYTVQDHIVLPPQRLLRRIVTCEVMVMIVVCIPIMGVAVVDPVLVILYRMEIGFRFVW